VEGASMGSRVSNSDAALLAEFGLASTAELRAGAVVAKKRPRRVK
jgi:hypothetical protein